MVLLVMGCVLVTGNELFYGVTGNELFLWCYW
jgi:hypothetical protein